MPLYDYSGQASSGALFQGTLEAEDVDAARIMLERIGVRIDALCLANRAAFVTPLSLAELTFFNEQLAALTRAELPLEQGLRQLAADVGSRKLKRLVLDLASDLEAGQSLPQALEKQSLRFPGGYPGVVRAGLDTGDLPGVLHAVSTELRLRSSFRRALLEVVTYPLLVLVLAWFVASFLMRYVLPLFVQTLRDIREDAGFAVNPTFGDPVLFSFVSAWPAIETLFLAALAILIVIAIIAAIPGNGPFRERVLRRVPGVSQVYWAGVLARFAHTTAIAAYSGTPLPALIRAGGRASGSPALEDSATRVAQRIERGDALSAAIGDEPTVPALWACAVETASPRGDLPAVLGELGRTYEQHADQAVAAMRAVLGPALLIFMAVTIGGLVAALLSSISWMITVLQSVTGF